MTAASDYLEAAAECRRTASVQKTLEMQEAWLMMAAAYERVAEKQVLLEDPAANPDLSVVTQTSETSIATTAQKR
jgi:hypothetical protein